ncbi:MAG: AI-2E family transporter, partial [Oscillospiraceae bacterium]|nr:AI-2E family transporter [Oscillospiraceae bacterium]
RMPYAFLVGVVIAVTALVPVFGAFIGGAVGVVVIAIESPVQALWFLLLFLVLQQVEGNLIYPKVVGNSVGLPSILVFISVILGNSLMGVAGMLFFIPAVSVVYTLVKEFVQSKEKQALPAETPEAGKEN